VILQTSDIFYSSERDGTYDGINGPAVEHPVTPIAFVIDGEVVFAQGFSPNIGDNIFLANPTYTSRIEFINGVETEIVIANINEVITEMIVNDLFTAVLLSNPLAILINKHSLVNTGWNYDENGFFIMQSIDGVEKKINDMGDVIS
jgi:hypothetical protein